MNQGQGQGHCLNNATATCSSSIETGGSTARGGSSNATSVNKNRVSEWFLEADRSHKLLTTSKSTPQVSSAASSPPRRVVDPAHSHHQQQQQQQQHQRLHLTTSDSRLVGPAHNQHPSHPLRVRRQPVHVTMSDVTPFSNGRIHMFPQSAMMMQAPPPPNMQAPPPPNMQAPPPPNMQAPPPNHQASHPAMQLLSHQAPQCAPNTTYLPCYANNALAPHRMVYQTNSDPCDNQGL